MSRESATPESGFTLIELLIAITVSGLIMSALVAGFIVALRGTAGANERFMGSNAAQTFATYFTTDVQSADPAAVRTDSVGTGCAPSSADTASSNVVRLQWAENTGGATAKAFYASYRVQQNGTEWQLVRYFCLGRSAADGVTTSGSTTVTSAKAGFSAADVGSGVSGAGIPSGAKIVTVNVAASSVVLSQAATGSASNITITITPAPTSHVVAHDLDAPGQRFRDGVTNGTPTLTSATANFTAGDVGLRLTGTNIPAGAAIASVTNGTTVVMSAAATGSGSSTFTVGRPVRVLADGVTANGSQTLTSSSAAFGAGDVGRALTGRNIPKGTTISSITNGTTAVMSRAATASGSSLTIGVGAPYAVVGPTTTAPSMVSLTLSGLKASSDSAPYSYSITATMRAPFPPPLVSSISLVGASPTNASSVQWTVKFNRPVTGVDVSDFSLAVSGVSGASGLSVAPSGGGGDVYTVILASTGTGDGSLGLNLIDDDSIIDANSKKLGGTGTANGNFTGDIYAIDRTAPTVVVAQKVDPDDATNNQPDPATSLPIVFTVSFSEPVGGFDATDVALTGTAPVGSAVKTVTGSRADYEVAVSGLSSGGTVIASVPAGAATDAAGNASLISDPTSDHTVTYNSSSPPAVTSITRHDADNTVASSVSWDVMFSQNVTGVDATDFALASSTVTGSITSVTGSNNAYVVTATLTNGTGTIGLNLNDNDTIVSTNGPLGGAGAGNGNFTGQAYTVIGQIASVALNDGGGHQGKVEGNDTIVVTFGQSMKVNSFCSNWPVSGDGSSQNVNGNGDVTVTLHDGTGATNDWLDLSVGSSICTFHFGTIDLGSNAYVSGGNAVFAGNGSNKSTIAWNPGAKTLTITLGSPSGGTLGTVASSVPTYALDPAIQTSAGVGVTSPYTGTNVRQF